MAGQAQTAQPTQCQTHATATGHTREQGTPGTGPGIQGEHMATREQAIANELALREKYKGLKYITGGQARWLHGYLLDNFIKALDHGLAMYDAEGNELKEPLGALALAYAEREVQKLHHAERRIPTRSTRILDRFSDFHYVDTMGIARREEHRRLIDRAKKINDNAVALFLDGVYFYQPQLVSIMQEILPAIDGKAKKKVGAPAKIEERKRTEAAAKRILELTYSETSPSENKGTMADFERAVYFDMDRAGEKAFYHQKACREVWRSKNAKTA